MPNKVPDKLTPLDIPSLWNALLLQWETLGISPNRVGVELKLAHIHLETGLRACHCWNLGNIKHRDGDGLDWCLFPCGEEVPTSRLNELMLMGPCEVASRYKRGPVDFASVKLYPPHPWCRFAAFPSLATGVKAQLAYLRTNKYAIKAHVLDALMTGDATAYNDALVAAGYYTAGKAQYLKTLKERLEIMRVACRDFNWGDVS